MFSIWPELSLFLVYYVHEWFRIQLPLDLGFWLIYQKDLPVKTEMTTVNTESQDLQDGGHEDENPFRCTECKYSCKTAEHLKRHRLKHYGEKLFSCSKCSSSFSNVYLLKTHLRTHSGENPFSCSQCNYSYTTSSSLKKHLRQHSREKSFSCSHTTATPADKLVHLGDPLGYTAEKSPTNVTSDQCNF